MMSDRSEMLVQRGTQTTAARPSAGQARRAAALPDEAHVSIAASASEVAQIESSADPSVPSTPGPGPASRASQTATLLRV